MNKYKFHQLTAKSGTEKVNVFIAYNPEKEQYWHATKGSHMAHLSSGKPFSSGKQLNNVPNIDVFTYFGDGNPSHPDNIDSLETFKWLLKDHKD